MTYYSNTNNETPITNGRELRDDLTEQIYILYRYSNELPLPKGSTVIDFAYKLHEEVAKYLVQAEVNGKPCKISTVLNNKDRVVVFTASAEEYAPLVSIDWLEMCKTKKAKYKIRRHFTSYIAALESEVERLNHVLNKKVMQRSVSEIAKVPHKLWYAFSQLCYCLLLVNVQ